MSVRERSKSAFFAPLFAFVVPGGGHLALGKHLTGLLLLLGTLTDIAAMIRFADEGGGKYALLIIFLGLSLPGFWFYSVFDTLQLKAKLRAEAASASVIAEAATSSASASAEPQPQQRTTSGFIAALQGISVIGLALILLWLVQAPEALLAALDDIGSYAPGAGLIILALFAASRRKNGMFKLGRFTVAAVMIVIGSFLLWDQVRGRNDIELLGKWWPAAFVLIGVEMVVLSLVYRTAPRKPAFDLGGALLATIIAVTAFGVTQYASMPFRWLDEFKVNLTGTSGYSEEKGFQYNKGLLSEVLDTDTSSIAINNPNGKVTVRRGDVDAVTVQTVMWVDSVEKTEADEVAEKSIVTINGGKKIEIEAKGHPYGANGNRVPRMNMIVTIPAHSIFGVPQATLTPSTTSTTEIEAELSLDIMNGSVDISGLNLPGGVQIRAAYGELELRNMTGPIDAETKNGGIIISDLQGDSTLSALSGNIKLFKAAGSVQASTQSGDIELQQITGDIETDTKNGQITIKEASGAIKADTLNGDIDLVSAAVGGDWDIDSSIGEIHLLLPVQGNYSVNGSVTFGDVSSDLPLTISKKTIRGSIGSGTFRININANSSILVNRYK
ncbi:DUF4097 and DUF4098 domain-containing protein YvlB [Paenibacillus taihuensis]|uniref:DUF4097 and DUF4098 domain-containing protein YvlB n=1 Tax=Paenibacillus taihuensis TaxID=1156355 RepID=A0A3D9RZB1_9BACL|nr:DUF4097 family beta strand repeat-containing protein [Paenibacillus taihuensis]REE85404.1 DUF4097 and DUF4098 domain-containing protein YvlB [Paenibacillus taihuensis]